MSWAYLAGISVQWMFGVWKDDLVGMYYLVLASPLDEFSNGFQCSDSRPISGSSTVLPFQAVLPKRIFKTQEPVERGTNLGALRKRQRRISTVQRGCWPLPCLREMPRSEVGKGRKSQVGDVLIPYSPPRFNFLTTQSFT